MNIRIANVVYAYMMEIVMKNKVKYDCDCIYIIINGCVYENDPYEDCKMCKGRGWYLGEKDEI